MTRTQRGTVTAFTIAFGVTLGLSLTLTSQASAQALCAREIQRLQQFGRGDSDNDGLTNCEEKKVTFTDRKSWDSDQDGISDGAEVAGNTDPLNSDTDGDGLSDGEEAAAGTSAVDPDSDNDGILDGADGDPAAALSDKIEGSVESIACPLDPADGVLTVLGNSIALTAATKYDGAETCEDLAVRIVNNGGAHVEVRVSTTAGGALSADRVDLEDADNDGSPDLIDNDDDNDGVIDGLDSDDDNDGVDDSADGDDATGIDEDNDDAGYEDQGGSDDSGSGDGTDSETDAGTDSGAGN